MTAENSENKPAQSRTQGAAQGRAQEAAPKQAGASLSIAQNSSEEVDALVDEAAEETKPHWSLELRSFIVFAIVGFLVGAAIALCKWITITVILHNVEVTPVWAQMLFPTVGLAAAALIRFAFKEPDRGTSDAFIKAFHHNKILGVRSVFARMLGAIATVGTGGALGFEGPSVLLGSSVGQTLGRRFRNLVGPRSDRSLMIAGAAAGVSAVFKAPATGVLFALEVPYRRDISRHALIPALVASSTAYLAYVLLLDNTRLIRVGRSELELSHEILGAAILGLGAGIVTRSLVTLWTKAKYLPSKTDQRWMIPLSGAVLAATIYISNRLVTPPIGLGPGENAAVKVILDPEIGLLILLALFALRALATSATLAGGGIGGVFIPLAVQGLLLGRMVELLADATRNGMYPVVGLAAVIGAGYRTPLAAVMFVAETTGRAEFVIPALIATAIAQAVMGESSISGAQISARKGLLERRLTLPASAVAVTTMGYVSKDDLVLDVIDRYGERPEAPAVPVVESDSDSQYVGILVFHDMANAIFNHGPEATVETCLRKVGSLAPDDPAIEAARLMNDSDTAAVAVVESNGRPVGVVSSLSITGLREVDDENGAVAR